MNRQQLINQVKATILKHVKPSRIWLYGSEAMGVATQKSDIDIAYWRDKDDSSHIFLANIISEAEQLQTLINIDVVDLSLVEDRLLNRVKSTGRVLYSATKELRAEDALFNFAKALTRYAEVVDWQDDRMNEDFYQQMKIDLLVKRFEFTFEMAWKSAKRVLSFQGIESQSPRDVLKQCFAQGWIHDEAIFLSMLEMRNTTAHTYDLSTASQILHLSPDYLVAFHNLYQSLEQQI